MEMDKSTPEGYPNCYPQINPLDEYIWATRLPEKSSLKSWEQRIKELNNKAFAHFVAEASDLGCDEYIGVTIDKNIIFGDPTTYAGSILPVITETPTENFNIYEVGRLGSDIRILAIEDCDMLAKWLASTEKTSNVVKDYVGLYIPKKDNGLHYGVVWPGKRYYDDTHRIIVTEFFKRTGVQLPPCDILTSPIDIQDHYRQCANIGSLGPVRHIQTNEKVEDNTVQFTEIKSTIQLNEWVGDILSNEDIMENFTPYLLFSDREYKSKDCIAVLCGNTIPQDERLDTIKRIYVEAHGRNPPTYHLEGTSLSEYIDVLGFSGKRNVTVYHVRKENLFTFLDEIPTAARRRVVDLSTLFPAMNHTVALAVSDNSIPFNLLVTHAYGISKFIRYRHIKNANIPKLEVPKGEKTLLHSWYSEKDKSVVFDFYVHDPS